MRSRSGKDIKMDAVAYLLQHPLYLEMPDHELARHLKHVGIYSPQTYVLDIRIKRIRYWVNQVLISDGKIEGMIDGDFEGIIQSLKRLQEKHRRGK